MNLQRSIQRTEYLFSLFVTEVESNTALGLTDLNKHGENVLVPLFAEIYGFHHLEKLERYHENHPAVDLGDKVARVAIQVTATNTSQKFYKTLRGFVNHKLYEQYDRVIIYVITKRKKRYTGKGYEKILEGINFTFDKNRDIQDWRDLLKEIKNFQLEKARRIEQILEDNFGEGQKPLIEETFSKHLQNQLAKEKQTKRYIPDVFVEVAEIKDRARYFSHPVLFFNKIVETVQRLDLSNLNRLLASVSLPSFELELPTGFGAVNTLEEVQGKAELLLKVLQDAKKELSVYSDRGKNLFNAVPTDKRYIIEKVGYKFDDTSRKLLWQIDPCIDDLRVIQSRVLLLISRAGQGKTNFVCDFAEHGLSKRSLPCLFFTGRELNAVSPERLGAYLAQTVNGSHEGNLEVALERLNRFGADREVPVTLIIDGINEHQNIRAFAQHLEQLLVTILDYKYIRVILTCREEYFEERFHNLKTSSFAEQIYFVSNLERHMSKMHRDHMVGAYFRFFNLQPAYISKRASSILENDTLLLRIFCEAYGDPGAKEPIQLPQVIDIYKDRIFRRYWNRKLEEIAQRHDVASHPGLGLKARYKAAMSQIIQLMIERDAFSNIPVSDIGEEHHQALSHMLAEDIIVRKDLVDVDDVLDEKSEVISFTFDEFRDFLLSNHLVNRVFPNNKENFGGIVDRLVASSSPVAEGVQTYLFFASRQPDRQEVLAIIAEEAWYKEAFIKSIFAVEDELITSNDLNEIESQFLKDVRHASWIIRWLVRRWSTEKYPQLNIRLLFQIFEGLDEPAYDKYVRPSVSEYGVYGFDRTRSWSIDQIADELLEAIRKEENWTQQPEFDNLMELMIYFYGIPSRGKFNNPTFITFQEFADKYPDRASKLLSRHTHIRNERIREQVWRMLTYLAPKISTSNMLVQQALEVFAEADGNNWRLAREIARFVRICVATGKIRLEGELEQQTEQATFYPYGIEGE